ncbi:diadenosine tetraphosphate (Ap4A) HIT family hydrolase [Rhizobium soli]|uniref:Diadenosine tetraphosphate (Ap4A) HIT family hydrolase n=1 Tax=Rhizobium soli TaxID=424798 RepID=A0A7X0JK30_9HYPH|nr:diadenosine tetraphosphate (Ap4A) HIT family hydrolase [Rhizobium soli]
MSEFELDGRIARDSDLIATLDLCQLRIQNDSRWPWLVMVPQRADMTEIFELSEADHALLSAEVNHVAAALKEITCATKINVGALGNIVRQLHVHVIARFEGDANWPGPIWGYGSAEPYDSEKRQALVNTLMEKLSR